VRRRKGAQDMALRARLILACDAIGEDGLPVSTKVVAEEIGVSRETVSNHPAARASLSWRPELARHAKSHMVMTWVDAVLGRRACSFMAGEGVKGWRMARSRWWRRAISCLAGAIRYVS
jgi:hypothetical protein